MYLIVGLGNPGNQYDKTRHNVGFDVINFMEDKYKFDDKRKKFKGIYTTGTICGEKVILLKPETYMNLSGESVRAVMDFYKISNKDVIVIYDDISLEPGRLRIREKGSAGGHNGIKSIIAHLGTDEFPRIKVGVGSPKHDLVNHVLSTFDKEDRVLVEKSIVVASEAVEEIIKGGASSSMNKFNSFKAV